MMSLLGLCLGHKSDIIIGRSPKVPQVLNLIVFTVNECVLSSKISPLLTFFQAYFFGNKVCASTCVGAYL